MANIPQIIAQIRFQLDQLSVNNAHHDFEHLCRHLTRARICSNILPSTGPVSTGGDQGRDFETFRTYLDSSPIANSTFIGLASDETIVFGCSLQKENIGTKIKHDINTIMSQGSFVDVIIYFCTSDIPVSKRHELQDWAKENYSIKLDIHDGTSISELLSDRDIFWIAGRYLSISSEIYPRSNDEEGWYVNTLESWRSGNGLLNYASFYEIKKAIRHATFNDKVKQDIHFWLNILEKFLEYDCATDLKRQVIYEISVTYLMGIGTLIGQENRIYEYFKHINDLELADQLEDAVVLLNYCMGARSHDLIRISPEELEDWNKQLIEKVENKLNTQNIGLKCQMLELRGYQNFNPLVDVSKFDLDDTINRWIELTEIVENAPLFPLDKFSTRLTKFIKFIGNHPKYDYLTQKVDSLLSKRTGEFNAAEKCRDRAIEFYKMGEILKAIDQLHHAKIKWFAEETLYGSLLTLIIISGWYLELGLTFAAKYYALAVSYISFRSPNQNIKKFIPQALFIAAECDYNQGAWCGFLELMNPAIKAHFNLSKNPYEYNVNKVLESVLHDASILIFVTKSFGEPFIDLVNKNIGQWVFFKEVVEKEASAISNNSPVVNIDDLWLIMENQLKGRPFGDCGHIREVSWSELGIIWKIYWENNYETTLISEQFIAILQIFLADLANTDLYLLKTDIKVSISINNEINEPDIESIPSNNGRKWQIDFPQYKNNENMENLQNHFIGLISYILYEVSLLPKHKFDKIIGESFKNGISMKTLIARPYADLLNNIILLDVFNEIDRANKIVPEMHRPFKVCSHEKLNWFSGQGQGYSKEDSKKLIKSHYERSIIPIRYTVERLAKDPEFISIIERLRADGWLDWHILLTINNIAIRYRIEENMREYPLPPFIDKETWYQTEWEMIIDNEESKNASIIPISEFNEEDIRMSLNFSMISTLKILGLECRQQTPDIEAINHFLSERYNYWTDDVEHEEFF